METTAGVTEIEGSERESRGELSAVRWLSGVAGGVLVIGGLRRRSLLGLLAAVGGGVLVWRALSGGSQAPRPAPSASAAPSGEAADPPPPFDVVGEASEESFPASDPPGWSAR